jgi:hypothetical protein
VHQLPTLYYANNGIPNSDHLKRGFQIPLLEPEDHKPGTLDRIKVLWEIAVAINYFLSYRKEVHVLCAVFSCSLLVGGDVEVFAP